MRIVEIFDKLEKKFVKRASNRLTQGEDIREQFLPQVRRYYNLLQQSVVTGEPQWMYPVLNDWVQVRTQTEVEKQEASLTILLNQIFTVTHQVASEELRPQEALIFIEKILPIHTHALEYATQQETHAHVKYVSSELENVRVQLEKLDRSKSDFISVAAHELKTPLTLIEGYMDMVRENIPDNEYIFLLLDGVENGTRRLQEIIEDMIDVSLIDNDLLDINFRPIWFNRLLKMAFDEFGKYLQKRNQTLEIHEFPGIDIQTYGDAERIYQVLKNLFSNAIKYTPDGGTITVSGRLLPGFIEITVADNGIGIAPENQDRIFQKFGHLGDASLHSSGKTKFKGGGPGLGLPIAKGIVEAHGGSIWVESEGHDEKTCPGTTFHVLFPILESPPDEKNDEPTQ
ncbi:MAG: HAMP domain-containing sensor histidine kinase [Chloroflexota bacterium]|nr:HAMP domain-containing sensor histidine kinase [Chloroflexota bacterium]